MVLMLAGLRGIDEDIWKSLSIEGVAKWKSYIFVILPMLRPMVVTAIVLIAAGKYTIVNHEWDKCIKLDPEPPRR